MFTCSVSSCSGAYNNACVVSSSRIGGEGWGLLSVFHFGDSTLLGGMLSKEFKGVSMPATMMFDYPSISAISEFLHKSMVDSDTFYK